MHVLYVCTEVFPLLKTGGLADVSAALPHALHQEGAQVTLLLPGFPALQAGFDATGPAVRLPVRGNPALPTGLGPHWADAATTPTLQAGLLRDSGQPTLLLTAPALFGREGNPYLDPQGQPWPDNPLRFAWLGWAAALVGAGLVPGLPGMDAPPDVVHGHDWHAGLAMAYLQQLKGRAPHTPASVFTVHNLAYQGLCGPEWLGPLGLPPSVFGLQGLEFFGQVSFMKAGLQFADALTTVSPGYAREITEPDQGCGLDGLLRHRQDRLHGILNGVDDRVWNPEHDALAPHTFSASDLGGKTHAKAALQTELALQVAPSAPLLVVVSRLTEQKGLHLLPEVVDDWVHQGGQLAVLGTGDATIENALAQCAQRHPHQVALRLGYHEALAHRLMAGGDAIAVPSRFEPCGLTQLYGLRYGTLPVVRAVGGLADTVTDCRLEAIDDGSATGIVFHDFSALGLRTALQRTLALYRRPADWAKVQQNAMAQRFGWRDAARAYLRLYQSLRPTATPPRAQPGTASA